MLYLNCNICIINLRNTRDKLFSPLAKVYRKRRTILIRNYTTANAEVGITLYNNTEKDINSEEDKFKSLVESREDFVKFLSGSGPNNTKKIDIENDNRYILRNQGRVSKEELGYCKASEINDFIYNLILEDELNNSKMFSILIRLQYELDREEVDQLFSIVSLISPKLSMNPSIFWLLKHKQFSRKRSMLMEKNRTYDIDKLLILIILQVLIKRRIINKSWIYTIENKVLTILGIQSFDLIPFKIREYFFKRICFNDLMFINTIYDRWFPKSSLNELNLLLSIYFEQNNNNKNDNNNITFDKYNLNHISFLIEEMLAKQVHLQNIRPDTELCDLLLHYLIYNNYQDEIEPWLFHLAKFKTMPTSLFVNRAICFLRQKGDYGLSYRLFSKVSAINRKLDPRVYISVLNVLSESKEGTNVTLPLVEKINDELKNSLSAGDFDDVLSSLPNNLKISYLNSFLKYSLSIRNLSLTQELLRKMMVNGRPIFYSEHTYTMLIREYATKHLFYELETTLDEMVNTHGFIPTPELYYYIIRSYKEKSKIQNAYKHLHSMLHDLKLIPTKETYDLFEDQ
ncbi:hypothetical protein K502DRAFT_367046 [Neoconidiobolus thromboides FSU 785]|nr:hypothetical protein K502DRAFT_367046 [Neoconidiobolus thromboides FSU 785]